MTNSQIARHWTPPRPNEEGAKAVVRLQNSYSRWTQFGTKLAERRCALRTANRKFRVHNGLSLKWS